MPPAGRAWRLVAPAATAIALLIAAALMLSGALDGAENATIDRRFDIRGPQPAPEVAVVGIDTTSIRTLGRWPFDRRIHARAVTRLQQAGVKLIVYDVQFTEPSGRLRSDLALFEAIGRAGGAVLATSTSTPDGRTSVLGGDARLREINSVAAATNVPADRGAVLRRYRQAVGKLRTLPLAAAERATGEAPGDDAFNNDGSAYIDFRGPPGTIRTVPFVDLVAETPDLGALRSALAGRIVVVGASAPALQDVYATSVGGSEVMSGPEVQANATWTALHDNPLRDAATGLRVLAFLLLGLAPLALMRRRALLGFAVVVVLGAAYVGIAILAFNGGTVLPLAGPLVALALTALAILIAGYASVAAQRAVATRVSEQLRGEIEARTAQLRDTQLEIVRRLAHAAERRDDETGAHLERIGLMTQRLALAAGLTAPQADLIRHASAMHDVGKIGIPDSVLHKSGELTPEEWEVMKTHPILGARILSNSSAELIQLAEEIARTHHERWDGSGYPNGLKGDAIPLAGRICAVCDVFDALVSRRPYKDAWPVERAVEEIRAQRGRQFDPHLADLFIRLVERGEIPKAEPVPPVPAT